MPAVQTTYSETHPALTLGAILDQETKTVISRIADEAITFGVPVLQGANEYSVKLVDASGDDLRGVTVRDQSVDPANPNAYAQYDDVGVMTQGVVVVTASVAVSAGEPAYFVPATGAITNVPTANTTLNAVFDADAALGALVPLRIG